MKSALKVILLISFLSSCASLPPGDMAAHGSVTTTHALVYLLNNIGGVKMGGELMVVNGTEGGTLDRREYTWFLVPEGVMKLSFNDTWMKSRKLSARVFEVEAGKTYYIGYSLDGYGTSDASLLYEAFSGASDGDDNFKSSDISLLSESNALETIKSYDLVGNKFGSM